MHEIDFTEVKHSTFQKARESSIQIGQGESLVPIGTWVLVDHLEILNEMWLWRRNNASYFFFDQLPTLESYTDYLTGGPIINKQRILFLVVKDKTIVGHLGLATNGDKPASIDNVLRGAGEGDSRLAGLMTRALQAVISWARETHGIRKFELEVRSDNTRAIEFYEKCGFSIIEVTRAGNNPDFSPSRLDNFEELKRIIMFRET